LAFGFSAGMCALFLLRDDLSVVVVLPSSSESVDRLLRTKIKIKNKTAMRTATYCTQSKEKRRYNPMMRPKNNNIH
jgi:hypothetical protein